MFRADARSLLKGIITGMFDAMVDCVVNVVMYLSLFGLNRLAKRQSSFWAAADAGAASQVRDRSVSAIH